MLMQVGQSCTEAALFLDPAVPRMKNVISPPHNLRQTPPEMPLVREEARRIEALRQYAVLDTSPEPAMDDLTTLAATICETPMALISLVGGGRLS